MSSMMKAQGWDRITKITPETFLDLDREDVALVVIWIEVEDGVYGRELRKGETVQGVVDYYTRRGWTDHDCTRF